MVEDIRLPYQETVPCLSLGGILVDNHLLPESPVNLVLKAFSRHGLVAGATGSGKTKTLQVLAEQLSLAGIPSLVMDVKGDISGLAMPGEASEALTKRMESLNLPFASKAFPVEVLTLSSELPGVPVRATVGDFGAILFSRMLGLNETQSGIVTIIFEYAKEMQLPLVDLADFKAVLLHLQTKAGKEAIEAQYGGIASSSVAAILRKVIDLESQGGDELLGEPAFDAMDLVRLSPQGQGVISVLRLMDMQDKPRLFSTFMLKLLSDIYRSFPELGDVEKPKLMLFIDEAHLIFNQATKALLNLLETMIKLIRSKGVGLVFCTQIPNDVPEAILSQLGLKIQHTLRAFTAKDRKTMKLVAQNFPLSEHYNTEQLLTSLGIGEALVSALDSKGRPTPLVHCLVRVPESRMGILSAGELTSLVTRSQLYSHYGQSQNNRSAKEILSEKEPVVSAPKALPPSLSKQDASVLTMLSKNTLLRQLARQFFRQITNQLLKLFSGNKR